MMNTDQKGEIPSLVGEEAPKMAARAIHWLILQQLGLLAGIAAIVAFPVTGKIYFLDIGLVCLVAAAFAGFRGTRRLEAATDAASLFVSRDLGYPVRVHQPVRQRPDSWRKQIKAAVRLQTIVRETMQGQRLAEIDARLAEVRAQAARRRDAQLPWMFVGFLGVIPTLGILAYLPHSPPVWLLPLAGLGLIAALSCEIRFLVTMRGSHFPFKEVRRLKRERRLIIAEFASR
jgi:hypothetical protein